MTPADELRAAITVLRCDHRFPIQPPAGSLTKPGHCLHCNISYRFEKPVADWLAEPLAVLLDETAHVMDCLDAMWRHQGGDPFLIDGMGTPRSEWDRALATARAITGGTP